MYNFYVIVFAGFRRSINEKVIMFVTSWYACNDVNLIGSGSFDYIFG